jgi:hypothetical protein
MEIRFNDTLIIKLDTVINNEVAATGFVVFDGDEKIGAFPLTAGGLRSAIFMATDNLVIPITTSGEAIAALRRLTALAT